MSNTLLDEGAKNSFIMEDLAHKLEIKPTESVALKISGFGGNKGHARYLNKVMINIKTYEINRVSIEVVIIPKIAAPLR